MATSYTSLLGLALPLTGELSGTWGDTVNNYITNYLDASIAGTQTITADTTLIKTTGSALGATSSQYMVLLCSPASANITVTAPAASKTYVVINTSATYTVTVRGAGPTTGVVVPTSGKAILAWNGSDFVNVGGGIGTSTNNQVLYNSSGGTAGISPGTNGNVLTSNGTTWVSSAPAVSGVSQAKATMITFIFGT
jgi:hypothetical protein